MKKLLVLSLCFFLSLGLLSAQHLKKDGTPDRRYKVNSSTYSAWRDSAGLYPKATTLKKGKSVSGSYRYKAGPYTKSNSPSSGSKKKSGSNYSVARDKNGKIQRSSSEKHAFMKLSGYPKGRPGYVVDHIIPLKKGGCDCPSNMQWQTVKAAREKDKWE